MREEMKKLQNEITSCSRCPRLRSYCLEVAQKKKNEFRDWLYWGKPVPPLGDEEAQLLIIGLAPAAHGANRTGRMFTGNGSGKFLISALYDYQFTNQPTSVHKDDGLKLLNSYITAIIKCAPPKNRPMREEIKNCSRFLYRELEILKNVKVVLTLGGIAFQKYISYLKEKGVQTRNFKFRHGARYPFKENLPVLYCSYHPSPQNTQTGRLTAPMFRSILNKIRKELR